METKDQDKESISDIKVEILTSSSLKEKGVSEAESSQAKSENIFDDPRLDPSQSLEREDERKDVLQPPLIKNKHQTEESIEKDSKTLCSRPLTDLTEELEPITQEPIPIEVEGPLSQPTIYEVFPPPYVPLPNPRSGGEEGVLFMAGVAVVAIAVVSRGIGPSSRSKPDSPVKNDPNNEPKDTVVQEKATTEICHSGKLEGNKVSFPTELSVYPPVLGESWVALKDQTVFTPEKFVIKQGQIGIVTKLEEFLTAVLTFDIENKEDLSSFLEEGGNYLVPFIPLSDLLPPEDPGVQMGANRSK